MHDPTPRASSLRTSAPASAVALVLALPLAFTTAGPSAPSVESIAGHAGPPAVPEPDVMSAEGPKAPSGAFCGAEVSSPEGVEAQTCVLMEGPDTWGRTYYRNTSSETLRAVLTVLRPDGETVEAYCEVPVSDKPGLCETPRGPTVPEEPGQGSYTAVAELARPGDEQPLLRAGSDRA